MKRFITMSLAIIILMSVVNSAFAYENETVFGNKVNGEILFNNLPWGTSREDVVHFLEEKFNSDKVKLKEDYKEYDYGTLKQIVCTYENTYNGKIGTVGDMDIDEIVIWYIYEEGKYNNSMYGARYTCESYSTYKTMAEMLEYKYGTPYSHYEEDSESYGSTFNVDRFTWLNKDETQELSITRNDSVLDFGFFLGMSGSKSYERSITIQYMRNDIDQYITNQREIYEAQQKENDLSNKNYDGL